MHIRGTPRCTSNARVRHTSIVPSNHHVAASSHASSTVRSTRPHHASREGQRRTCAHAKRSNAQRHLLRESSSQLLLQDCAAPPHVHSALRSHTRQPAVWVRTGIPPQNAHPESARSLPAVRSQSLPAILRYGSHARNRSLQPVPCMHHTYCTAQHVPNPRPLPPPQNS